MSKRYNDDELALLFKRLFHTDDGKAVLEVLEKRFSSPSVVPNSTLDGVALAHFTFMRAGEINVYRYIETLTNKEDKK